jgi:HK97 family phage portal protein
MSMGPTAGQVVTLESSLRDAATWACQRVLISTISMLPVHAFREADGRLQQLNTDPQLVRNPSSRVSRRGWVAQLVRSGLQAGNLYGDIVATNSMGFPTQIETVSPAAVTWINEGNEEVPFVNGKRRTLWPLGDFWHVPISQFLVAGTRVALSPTDYGATSIGTSLAAEKFGADYFGDSGHPTKTVKVNADIDADEAYRIKQAVLNATRGNREPFVHGSDIEVGDWSSSLKDDELIGLLQFEVLQACRRLGVPPSMVYAAITGQNVTYSNVSQSDLQFLKYSVQAWIQDLEDAWSDLCAMPHMVKFNTDAVLRMDAISRAELHEVRLRTKTRTVNEVRLIEDEEPFKDPAYDEPGVPGGAPVAPPADPVPTGA